MESGSSNSRAGAAEKRSALEEQRRKRVVGCRRVKQMQEKEVAALKEANQSGAEKQ